MTNLPFVAAQSSDKGRFVLNGMKVSRGQLKSGVCRASGRLSEGGGDGLAGAIAFLIAFDAAGHERFDCTAPGWVIDAESQKPDPLDKARANASSKRGEVSARFLRTPSKSAFWVEGQPIITLHPPNFQPPNAVLRRFDVKSLGIAGLLEQTRATPIDALLNDLSATRIPAVEETEPDVWQLTWQYSGPMLVEWQVWVNVKQGYTPFRSLLRERQSRLAEWRTTQQNQTKWSAVNGVWVPVQYALDASPVDGRFTNTRQLKLEWSSVNEIVDKSYFSVDGFGAPKTVGLVDTTLGQPITIRPYEVFVPPTGGWRWYYTVALVATILIGLVLALWRFRRKPAAAGRYREQTHE